MLGDLDSVEMHPSSSRFLTSIAAVKSAMVVELGQRCRPLVPGFTSGQDVQLLQTLLRPMRC